MKNFYEDSNIQDDIEDISSGRFDFSDEDISKKEKTKAPVKPPHLPGVKPTVSFKKQEAPIKQEPTIPEGAIPVYNQFGQLFYAKPLSEPGAEPPIPPTAPYPWFQMPVYGVPTPPAYAPVQQPYNPAVSAPTTHQAPKPDPSAVRPTPPGVKAKADLPDSGMRVLYQSEEFEKSESEGFSPPSYTPYYSNISHEDVTIEEETITSKRKTTPLPPERKKTSSPFREDEMEIGTFELNAMALGRNTKANPIPHIAAVKKPKTEDVAVEEYEVYFNKEEVEEEPVVKPGSPQKKKKKKKASTFEIIRKIILTVSIIAFAAAAGVLFNEYRMSKENDEAMSDAKELIIDVSEEPVEEPTTKNKDKNKDKDKNKNKTTTAATTVLSDEAQWAQLKSEYPNTVFPANLQLKYAKLYATNNDFAGYLRADGIGMDLPVVQADNDDEYLEKNFYGNKTKYGCPFVTHINNLYPLDTNTIIFGHHMNNGTVFGSLDDYKTIEGFKKAPLITFNTLYEDYSWKVIAAFITNAYEKDDNGYVFKYYFSSLSTTERFSAYLNELSQRSLYDTGVNVLPTDKLLTLSTCSYEFEDARFVVVARLVRRGESADVDVSAASVNDNPRYPQAYYDKMKKENPYADAYRWEVG